MIPEDERWSAGPSGDMTLSVVSSTGEQVLRVDMLSQGTMKAGLSGDRLARALNDLSLVAALPELLRGGGVPELPHPGAAHSPLPWRVVESGRRISVKDADGRRIASREFPRTMPAERVGEIVGCLQAGLERVSRVYGVTGGMAVPDCRGKGSESPSHLVGDGP